MRVLAQILVAALPIAIVSCSGASIDSQMEGERLMQLSRNWSKVVASGDLDAAMEFWADDAVMLPPGAPALEGKQAIRRYIESASKVPGFGISWEPLSVYVSTSGDLAYMIERNVTTVNDATGTPVVTHGKAVTIWKRKDDGTWKNILDTWNHNPVPGNE